MGRRILDVTGLDDQDHLAVIGAALKAQSVQSLVSNLGLSKVKPDWMGQNSAQGVSQADEELDYLPLDGYDHTNATGGPIDVESQLTANPQRPFRGERVVLTCIYISGGGAASDALFRLLITPAMYVGAVQIGATQGAMPGSAFSATAFGVRLSMPAAGQGTRIYIPFRFAGVLNTDRLIVAGGVFGRAVR
jgi:hypothetical protein